MPKSGFVRKSKERVRRKVVRSEQKIDPIENVLNATKWGISHRYVAKAEQVETTNEVKG